MMRNKNSVFISDGITVNPILGNEDGLRYNLYRDRIERLTGWLEDQVVCSHMFDKMKEIRNRRIMDSMVIRPLKGEENDDKNEQKNKCIKGLGENDKLGPMEIYLKQDAERRASQIIRRSGFIPASLDTLLRKSENFPQSSLRKNTGNSINLDKEGKNDNSEVVDAWFSSGMSPGDYQIDMPIEYNDWKTQRMMEMLAPDLRLRKNMLNESLKKIKPIPLENKIDDNDVDLEDMDENKLVKNTECIFAPPLAMPDIKPKLLKKMMSPNRKSQIKGLNSPVRIGIDMNEIAKVIVKQVHSSLESTVINNKDEIGKRIDILSDHIKILEDKTNLLMENNSPKHYDSDKLKEIEEIVKDIRKNSEKEKLPVKQSLQPPTPLPVKKEAIVESPPKIVPKKQVPPKQHEKVVVKFSQYFLMFKRNILKIYEKLSLAFNEMEPNSDNEVSLNGFVNFLKKNKIPGSALDHNKLFEELMGQNKMITKLTLYKKLHPMYEDNSEIKLIDFVKLLDEIYQGCEIPMLVSTFEGTTISKLTFTKFGRDQLGLNDSNMSKIWENYLELVGDNNASNSKQLIQIIMNIREELGLNKVEKNIVEFDTTEPEKVTIIKTESKKELCNTNTDENKADLKEYTKLDSIDEVKLSPSAQLSSSQSSLNSLRSELASGSSPDQLSIQSSLTKNKLESKSFDSDEGVNSNSDYNSRPDSSSDDESKPSGSDSEKKTESSESIHNVEESELDVNSEEESKKNELLKNDSKIVSFKEENEGKSGKSSVCSSGSSLDKESLVSSPSSDESEDEKSENRRMEEDEMEVIKHDPTRRAIYLNLNPEIENLPVEERLKKRIIEVYGTVGKAYKTMCGGNLNKIASISEFGDFIEGLNIYLSFSESKEFYKQIVNKKEGGLTLGLLYSFVHDLSHATTAEPDIINKHLKEIYGSVEEAFKSCNIYDQDTMNLEDFIKVCKDSGYNNKSLGKLYGEMTGSVEGGLVEVQDVIQCILGHITPKEVYKDESYRNSQWALWRVTPCRKATLNPSIIKTEIDDVVNSLLSNVKIFKNIGREELYNIVDTYFMREKLQGSSQIMEKDEKNYSLSVILTGGVDSIESLWYGENILESYKNGDIIGLEMIEKKPSTKMLRTNSETILWKLTPEIWESKVKPKIEELKDNFISIKDYFENDKIFSKLDDLKKKELLDNTLFTRYPSKTCIFKQGELAKSFILVFDGSVSLKVDGDYSMIPEKYRDKTPGSSIGDKYLFNRLEYPYSCYCSSDSESVIIATISGNIMNNALSEEIKKELIKLEDKYEKKFPIPIQSNLRFPDLKLVPKEKLIQKNRNINENSSDDNVNKKTDVTNKDKNDEFNKEDNNNIDNIDEKSLIEKRINLEYLKSDIQSRILRKHTSLYECFNYIYEKYVPIKNKEKLKNNLPRSLFDEECQPSKEYIKKWPKYDKLFIGNWIDMDAFAEYVSEHLHINATFTDLTKIFESFSEPLTDRLYIGTFYRNFERISELSLRDFNRRLVEIDGGSYNTFTKLGGVIPGGSVSTDTFIVIGGRAGFTRPEATDLFLKQLDVLKSKTVSLSTLVKLISSEITIDEAKELESGYGLFSMAQDYFGGGGETVSKLISNSSGDIDYDKFNSRLENIACENNELSEITNDENNIRLLNSFDYLEPICVLNTNQRLWLLSLLEKKHLKKGNKFINQGDPNAPLVIVYKGEISVMQTGFFGYDSKLEEIKIENKVKLYGWNEYYSKKQAIEASLIAEKDSIVYLLSRKEIDQLIEIINDRVEKIKNIYLVLLKTPNIRDWPTNVLEIFSCCLKVEVYDDQSTILEMGPCKSNDLKFYIIVQGEVSIQGIPIGDTEEVSDYNIGKNRYFGEWSIINNYEERTSTVISNCKNTCLLSIPKKDFKRVLSLIGDYALHRFQDYGLQLYHFSPKHSKRFNSKIKSK